MTIDYKIKQKAIELYNEGKGRNEIARILNGQKIKISEATITHLIQDWKSQQHQQQSESSSQLNESVQYQTSVSSKKEQLEDKGETPLMSEKEIKEGQEIIAIFPGAPNTAINKTPPLIMDNGSLSSLSPPIGDRLEPAPKNSGNPLSFFLGFTAATAGDIVDAATTTSVNHPVESVEPKITVMQVDKLDVNSSQHDSQIPTTEAESAVSENQECIDLDSEEALVTGSRRDSEEGESSNFDIDWDSDENWASRVFREVRAAKKERRDELLLIEQKLNQLNQEREQLAQIKHNIDEQMTKAAEVELLLPLARQLRDLGVDITNFLPWVETIQEHAMNHNTSLTTAAFEIVGHLKAYNKLEILQNAIGEAQGSIQQLQIKKQQTEQELAMLNMSTTKYQDAIRTLVALLTAGFSSDQISELTGLVNLWNGIGAGTGGLGFRQENGSGKSKLDDRLIKY
jgi:hypothetical protein